MRFAAFGGVGACFENCKGGGRLLLGARGGAGAMNGEDGGEFVTLVDLLDRLVKPPEPAPIPFRPETAGWTVIAVLIVGALLAAVVLAVRRWWRNAYRREALAALAAAGEDAARIAAVVRRTALVAYGRPQVASLAGEEWLAFLDATGGGGEFANGPGRALVTLPYRADGGAATGLARVAGRWIRRHRVAKASRTGEDVPEAAKSSRTGEAAPEAAKASRTGEAVPEAAKVPRLGEAVPEAAEAARTGEAVPRAAEAGR